jgi:hypothetical protein
VSVCREGGPSVAVGVAPVGWCRNSDTPPGMPSIFDTDGLETFRGSLDATPENHALYG